MAASDEALWVLVKAILAADEAAVARQLAASPSLAGAVFETGASRESAKDWYVREIERYIYAGDTALHVAAAAYRTKIMRVLVAAGANVHARNRHGDQPLHAAAVSSPRSHIWNPSAQTAAIAYLIEVGADPNAGNKLGVTPLHRAVRTRCAAAVQTLLDHGADPTRKNKSGSTPLLLARHNTGRGGTGLPEAKAQQQEIIQILEKHTQPAKSD